MAISMRTGYVLGLIATLTVACGSNGTSSDGGGTGGTGGSGTGAAGTTGAGGTAGRGGTTGAGGTTGVGGSAGAGGAAGAGGSVGGTGMTCGGIAGRQCGALDWCDFPGDTCGSGDQQGQCQPRDATGSDCTTPVCGCDGNSYPSACAAHENGVDAISSKSCIPGNGGAGSPCSVDGDCMTGFKCCSSGGAVGSPIACKPIAAGSQCPALP